MVFGSGRVMVAVLVLRSVSLPVTAEAEEVVAARCTNQLRGYSDALPKQHRQPYGLLLGIHYRIFRFYNKTIEKVSKYFLKAVCRVSQ